MKHTVQYLSAGLVVLLGATPALAHTGHGSVSGLVAGLTHPILGIDHLLAILSVGIWSAMSAQRDDRNSFWLPGLTFIVAMLAGAAIAFSGISVPAVETGIAVSVLLIGLMIAMPLTCKDSVGLGLIFVFAILHGHAHGSEAIGTITSYMTGFGVTTALLLLAGSLVGMAIHNRNSLAATIGSAVAVAGAAMAVI